MNSIVVVRANDQAEPSLVVFGRDDAGKPRASWFDAASADLAIKAGEAMRMRILKVETEEQKDVARHLAPGRMFASGRAFTPFARATVFSKLVELAGAAATQHGRMRAQKVRCGGPWRQWCSGQRGAGRTAGGHLSGRRTGTKSALAAWCWRPSGSRTGGGKASSSALTPMRFRSSGATSRASRSSCGVVLNSRCCLPPRSEAAAPGLAVSPGAPLNGRPPP